MNDAMLVLENDAMLVLEWLRSRDPPARARALSVVR
jgi:hypothetical protein